MSRFDPSKALMRPQAGLTASLTSHYQIGRTLKPADIAIIYTLMSLGADKEWKPISQRFLNEYTAYARETIRKSLCRLEACGKLSVRKPRSPLMEHRFKLTEKGIKSVPTRWPLPGPLPDCFRTPDFKGPGWMYQVVDKSVPLTLEDLVAASGVRTHRTIHQYVDRLAGLPAPVVTVAKEGMGTVYTFHEMSLADEDMVFNLLDNRDEKYRPTTMVTTAAANDRERNAFYLMQRNREESYDDTLSEMLGLCVVDERGCYLYGGDLDSGGYAKAPGCPLPFGTAHRASYRVQRGPIERDYQIHHVCGVRKCLNPDHLLALPEELHQWYTEHHDAYSGQVLQYVVECRDHGLRFAVGNPAPPVELFTCMSCPELELVSIIPGRRAYELAS